VVWELSLITHFTFYLHFIRIVEMHTCNNLTFILCIIRHSRRNQHNAQICTTDLFCMLAPTCFGSSQPSSGNFWIRLSYVKIQIDMVVYHIMWLSGLCVGVLSQLGSTTDGTTTLRHTGHLTKWYDKPPYRSVFSPNSDGSRSSLKMADYCWNM
jgi:hypothetical protein